MATAQGPLLVEGDGVTAVSACPACVAAAAAERLARVERDVQRSGAEYLHVSTGRDWLADVVAFAAGRRARHRADALGRVLS